MTRFAAAAAALLFSASALAQPAPIATLTDFHGRVMVNQGGEFVPAVKNMALKPGDRIMAQDDAEAKLVFSDDCTDEVEENKIYTVPDRSTCAGATPLVQELNPAGGNAIGAGATGTGNGGVAAMVAIVAAIDIWWLNEDDHDVVSP